MGMDRRSCHADLTDVTTCREMNRVYPDLSGLWRYGVLTSATASTGVSTNFRGSVSLSWLGESSWDAMTLLLFEWNLGTALTERAATGPCDCWIDKNKRWFSSLVRMRKLVRIYVAYRAPFVTFFSFAERERARSVYLVPEGKELDEKDRVLAVSLWQAFTGSK